MEFIHITKINEEKFPRFILPYNKKMCLIIIPTVIQSRCQWPRGLRRRSSAARLMRLWVRIPPGHGCLSVVSVVCYQVEVSATD